MKYCTKCGAQIHDEAVVCVNCGAPVASATKPKVKGLGSLDKNVTQARTIAIVGMALAAAYFIEGIASVIVALFPMPFIGILVFIFLSLIEFALMVSSVVVNIVSLVKINPLSKTLSKVPECPEKKEIASKLNLAKVFSYIGIGVTAGSVLLLTILNFFELLLSFI